MKVAAILTYAKLVLKIIGRFFRDADVFLLAVGVICAIYGIILISSVTANYPGGSMTGSQISALVLGIFMFILFSYIDIDIIADRSVLLYFGSMGFIFTLFFWGEGMEEWGNTAWLRFGNTGIQPAEITKITFTIIMGRMLANHREKKGLNEFVSLVQIMAVFGSMFGLIIWVSSDLGSALVYAFMLITMMFVAGVRLRWFAIGSVLIAASSPVLFSLLNPRQQERILAPFIPEEVDPTRQGVLWQANQSLRAIQSGGFTGQGLGQGELTQSNIIPLQHNDFIFSAAGEELGFIGAMAIIVLLTIIIIRCFHIGIKSNNPIGMLVCVGVSGMFIAQTLENIGMCLGLLPVVGITLPFFSQGGSSLVTCMAALGLVSGVKMHPKPTRYRII